MRLTTTLALTTWTTRGRSALDAYTEVLGNLLGRRAL
jgi:hypothetical protein